MSTTLQTDAIFVRAKNHLKHGEISSAIELLRSLMVLGIEEPRVLETLGVAYSLAGDSEWATALLTRTIQESPRRVSAYINLGAHLTHLDDYVAAVACLQQALQITQESADVYHNLGIAYQELRDWGQSQAAFQNAIRLKPDFVAAYYRLAQVLWHSKNTELAIAYLRKVLELDPQHARARRSLDEILSAKSPQRERPRVDNQVKTETPATQKSQLLANFTQDVVTTSPVRQVTRTPRQLTDIKRQAAEIATQTENLIDWFESTGADVLSQLRRQVANGVNERPAFIKARSEAVTQVRDALNQYARLEESFRRLQDLERS